MLTWEAKSVVIHKLSLSRMIRFQDSTDKFVRKWKPVHMRITPKYHFMCSHCLICLIYFYIHLFIIMQPHNLCSHSHNCSKNVSFNLSLLVFPMTQKMLKRSHTLYVYLISYTWYQSFGKCSNNNSMVKCKTCSFYANEVQVWICSVYSNKLVL